MAEQVRLRLRFENDGMASVAWKSFRSCSAILSKRLCRGQNKAICEELHLENFMLKFLNWENA